MRISFHFMVNTGMVPWTGIRYGGHHAVLRREMLPYLYRVLTARDPSVVVILHPPLPGLFLYSRHGLRKIYRLRRH